MNKKHFLGIDIGGTKIALALVDDTYKIIAKTSFPTPTTSAEELYDRIVQGIHKFLVGQEVEIDQIHSIGAGVPGKVDPVKGVAIKQNNIPWEGFPVVARLQEDFPGKEINIENDVKAAAWAEYKVLNHPVDFFEYVTLSTGIAASSIINGKILRGAGFSGEIGLIHVDDSGSFEQLFSGPGIARQAQEVLGHGLTTKEVFELWRQGDQEAIVALINRAAQETARILHSIISLHDPQIIVLGGSVAVHNPDYVNLIKERLSTMLHSEQTHILDQIKVSTIAGDNGLIGPALLAER